MDFKLLDLFFSENCFLLIKYHEICYLTYFLNNCIFLELIQEASDHVFIRGCRKYPTCAHEYNDNKFSILARGRTSFHLSTLEATYIKTSKPNLCKQKEFVFGLKFTH